MGVGFKKVSIVIAVLGASNHFCRKINTDSIERIKGSKQLTSATAYFDNPLSGWNNEL
jgi:hypothetical protein